MTGVCLRVSVIPRFGAELMGMGFIEAGMFDGFGVGRLLVGHFVRARKSARRRAVTVLYTCVCCNASIRARFFALGEGGKRFGSVIGERDRWPLRADGKKRIVR